MENKKLKFIVIGCGHIGKRHAAMIAANGEAELVALVDVKEKTSLGLEAFDVPFFASFDALIQSGIAFDVANIAVPNGLHATLASACLNAGKDVVIEKPMTLKSEDAAALIKLAKEANRRIFVVKQNRYSPPSQWLKEMMESNRLGKIFMVSMNCFWNRDERYYTGENWHGDRLLDGGTLFTQFSHFIDIMYWLFGDITNIQSRMYDFNHQGLTQFEDSGIANFEFEQGGIGSINFTTSVFDKNLESSITIIAEKGSIKVGGQYMDKVEYCHVKDYEMPELSATLPGNDYGAYKGSAANHHFVIENVINVIKNGADYTTPPEDGLKVVAIIERIYLAAAKEFGN